MTYYTKFTTPDNIQAAYIYKTKKQLVAADNSGIFKQMQGPTHFITAAGIRDTTTQLKEQGYRVYRPQKPDAYQNGDFLLPYPGVEYLLKPVYYY